MSPTKQNMQFALDASAFTRAVLLSAFGVLAGCGADTPVADATLPSASVVEAAPVETAPLAEAKAETTAAEAVVPSSATITQVAPQSHSVVVEESQGGAVLRNAIAEAGGVSIPSLPPLSAADLAAHQGEVDKLCGQIGGKLSSVDTGECLDQLFRFGGGYSVHGRPLIYKEVAPTEKNNDDFRVLLMGGVHGDEYSSISIIFKWLALYSPRALEGQFHWRFAPLVNPDGLLHGTQAVRQNANGVDLNRNFPSADWNASAVAYWQDSTGSNPRRFPGSRAASEPEVQWVVQQIVDFQPDVIVSVHAPYHLLDFDGPANAPRNIGELYLHQLGVYPGSLGNYAGLNKSIPVVTLELPSAGIMPANDQIALMWRDLVSWLDKEGRQKLQAPHTAQTATPVTAQPTTGAP